MEGGVITILKRLLDGRTARTQFEQAKAYWEDFLPCHRDDDVRTLAKALSGARPEFEALCFVNDADTRPSLMGLTCIAMLYDERAGFTDRDYAERLIAAFEVCAGRQPKGYGLDSPAKEMFLARMSDSHCATV